MLPKITVLTLLLLLGWQCSDTSPHVAEAPTPNGLDTLQLTKANMYQFPYPKIALRRRDSSNYVFLLAGPPGNWRAVGGKGVAHLSRKTGTFPFTLQVERTSEADSFAVELEFIGTQFVTPEGTTNERGRVYSFGYAE